MSTAYQPYVQESFTSHFHGEQVLGSRVRRETTLLVLVNTTWRTSSTPFLRLVENVFEIWCQILRKTCSPTMTSQIYDMLQMQNVWTDSPDLESLEWSLKVFVSSAWVREQTRAGKKKKKKKKKGRGGAGAALGHVLPCSVLNQENVGKGRFRHLVLFLWSLSSIFSCSFSRSRSWATFREGRLSSVLVMLRSMIVKQLWLRAIWEVILLNGRSTSNPWSSQLREGFTHQTHYIMPKTRQDCSNA